MVNSTALQTLARTLILMAILFMLPPHPVSAQSEARQATPDEIAKAERGPQAAALQEVPNPMLLEVKLGAGGFGPRIPALDASSGKYWFTTSTSKFVCDRARVQRVAVRRLSNSKKKVELEVSPSITSEWYRQDIDLTMTVETASGEVIARRVWDDLTIGNGGGPYSGGTKSPELKFTLTPDRFAELFEGAEPPILRMTVEIQGEPGDEDED